MTSKKVVKSYVSEALYRKLQIASVVSCESQSRIIARAISKNLVNFDVDTAVVPVMRNGVLDNTSKGR